MRDGDRKANTCSSKTVPSPSHSTSTDLPCGCLELASSRVKAGDFSGQEVLEGTGLKPQGYKTAADEPFAAESYCSGTHQRRH